MPAATEHPDANVLTDFVLGRLEEGTLESIGAHLETCTECQETLNHLDASDDTLIRSIASKAPKDSFADERECDVAISAIRRIGVAPQGEETCDPAFAGDSPVAAEEPLGTLRDYQLLAKLGEGGMGAVYRARHLRLDRLVALKVLPTERMQQPEALARFHREMKAVGNLNHPNIVQAHDAGDVDGKHFLVMELVDGVDLAALVEREGPLPAADACELIRQAAVGLDHAHRHGLVHRDVKPSNLMLNRAGVVKVLDLGLARVLGEKQGDDAQAIATSKRQSNVFQSISGELTGADQIMGTPDYMAPEQLNDSRTVDARSDVYGLGATLYKLLAGAAPFTGEQYDTLAKKMVGLAEHAVPPITERRDGLSLELVDVVQRMLAKDPAQRYASPAQVAAALAPFCEGQDVLCVAEATPSIEGMTAPTALGLQMETRPIGSGAAATAPAWGGGGAMWIVGAALAAFAALAATVIYIQTNNGTLVIRFHAPDEFKDEFKIEILDQEVVIGRRDVSPGDTDITLPVGEYRIQLAAGADDRITVQKDQVAIARGEQRLVTLSWNDAPPASDADAQAFSAGPDIKERYAAMRAAYHESMTDDERQEFIMAHSPILSAFDPAAAGAVLEFAAGLPESAQTALLNDGYLKWRYARLDQNRMSLVRTVVVEILAKSPNVVPSASGDSDQALAAWLLAGDYGYAVLSHPMTNRQVVVAYFTTPEVQLPMILPIAGRIGDAAQDNPREWAQQSTLLQSAWPRQLLALQDKPYSHLPPQNALFVESSDTEEPPAELPQPVTIAEFDPQVDAPISESDVRTEVAGDDSTWRISVDEARTVRLFEVKQPGVDDCVLTYRVQMKTQDVRGRVFLEMWCQLPGVGEAFSKGFHHAVVGTNGWANYETPFLLREGQRPESIKLNVVLEGAGTVWINQAELIATPTRNTGE